MTYTCDDWDEVLLVLRQHPNPISFNVKKVKSKFIVKVEDKP